jgi:hypothetical protein
MSPSSNVMSAAMKPVPRTLFPGISMSPVKNTSSESILLHKKKHRWRRLLGPQRNVRDHLKLEVSAGSNHEGRRLCSHHM